MIVEITASAERDLENIADHIARDSALAALRFIDALQAKCVDLGESPYAFPLGRVVIRYDVALPAPGVSCKARPAERGVPGQGP